MGGLTGRLTVVTNIQTYIDPTRIGVQFQEHGNKWFNVVATENVLKEMRGPILKVGNFISYSLDSKGNIEPESISVLEYGSSKEGGEKDWGDDKINLEHLLDVAHKKFKELEIKTEIITYDIEKKWAVFKATVIGDGKTFIGHGDAIVDFEGANNNAQNQTGRKPDKNITSMIAPHFIRMAETRAVARALRWATNNASTSKEENGEKK